MSAANNKSNIKHEEETAESAMVADHPQTQNSEFSARDRGNNASKATRNESYLSNPKNKFVLAVSLTLVLFMALALGLVSGFQDDCERPDKRFQTTLTIHTDGPMVELSNTTSVSPAGDSSTTWFFPYYLDDNYLEPLYVNFGQDGWIDNGVRIRTVDDRYNTMSIKVYFHTLRAMEQEMRNIFSLRRPYIPTEDALGEIECTRDVYHADLYSVPMGDETGETIELGSCTVTRQDSDLLQPQTITFGFSGTVKVDRGWAGSPRYNNNRAVMSTTNNQERRNVETISHFDD